MYEVAPLFDHVAEGPANGAAHWVKTTDGYRIRVAHWTTPEMKGTVLLFPGRTEYIEKYGRDAVTMQENGFATVTIDWRGQGLADRLDSNRLLGHVHAFQDYQHDVRAMVHYAKAMNLPRPFFLLAHSMGGCIGLRSLHDGLEVCAAMFSAPMWGIHMPSALRPLAWGISTLSRPLGFSTMLAPGQNEETYVLRAEFDENSLTSDPDMFDYMRRQLIAHPELALGGPTLNWLNQALVEMRRLRSLTPPDVPTFTALGTDEAIVDPARVKQVMSRWTNGRLEMFEGARHELLMELPATRNKVFAKMFQHFRQYLTQNCRANHA